MAAKAIPDDATSEKACAGDADDDADADDDDVTTGVDWAIPDDVSVLGDDADGAARTRTIDRPRLEAVKEALSAAAHAHAHAHFHAHAHAYSNPHSYSYPHSRAYVGAVAARHMMFPEDKMGLVIGKGGAVIKEIIALTGCQSLPAPRGQVKLRGTEAQLAAAQLLVTGVARATSYAEALGSAELIAAATAVFAAPQSPSAGFPGGGATSSYKGGASPRPYPSWAP